ncbi:prepilin-type N-terminal cleavage/methylation domain-containing protein [Hydrogenivirga caldilitoris]|uniref:Prepilin-type N-terminal cleavage/methylation domain-containing protein n=1 Tax=Hydrogenivirga caldilitoris TaxID=246264 RepID=A0A497XMI3_9AQUI|nr:prepilin-type N-terminal cleavage/methylation domain-containing protein [Hydrogenivirga caldilitoris]RLJ70126.1 prepilin-type N-terminal cleavage/methylation domain-containing protein [Hydrogenivirga caldilitoris]
MRRERGFTLIELAIVLVIIGIIIGMVLKGQDLIQNARMKKLVNEVRKWEVALWTCFDRKGKFPGDSNNDGIIDSDPKGGSDSCWTNLAQAPTSNTVQLGSYTFYIYPGSDTSNRNVIAVCGDSNCGTVTGDETYADYLRNLDIAFDGEVSATAGVVRALSGGTANSGSGIITSATAATSGDWTSTTKGALYYFDRKP